MKRRTWHVIASGGLLACVVALLSALTLSALTLPAFAQAAPQYQDSEPGAGSSVQSAPDSVSITFNEPLDDDSTITVANECGKNVDNGVVTVNLNEMSVGLDEAHYSGTYEVSYAATGIGGVTGTTKGSFDFTAAEGHPCDGHEEHKKNEHKKNEHQKHEHKKNEHEGHTEREHEGHSGTDHTDHTNMTHTSHSEMDASHSHAAGGTHEHKSKSHKEHGGDEQQHGSPSGDQAAGLLPKLPADGKAVLIALGLCAVMGAIGGIFLRVNTN